MSSSEPGVRVISTLLLLFTNVFLRGSDGKFDNVVAFVVRVLRDETLSRSVSVIREWWRDMGEGGGGSEEKEGPGQSKQGASLIK
jgi:hypothetical protein